MPRMQSWGKSPRQKWTIRDSRQPILDHVLGNFQPSLRRCEKNDFRLIGRSAVEKLRARMPYKRLLRLRYTFPFKNKTPIKLVK